MQALVVQWYVGTHLLAFRKLLYFFYILVAICIFTSFLYSLGEPEGYAYPEHLHLSQQVLKRRRATKTVAIDSIEHVLTLTRPTAHAYTYCPGSQPFFQRNLWCQFYWATGHAAPASHVNFIAWVSPWGMHTLTISHNRTQAPHQRMYYNLNHTPPPRYNTIKIQSQWNTNYELKNSHMNPKRLQVQRAGQLIFFKLGVINAATLVRDSHKVWM